MKRIKLLTFLAMALVVAIGLAGDVLAQVPSLVTQQLRLSTGGATPSYVQLRGITGAAPSNDYYQLDQAPAPLAGQNYSLWLNDQNQIVRSNAFGAAQAHYLLQVNATGNGLQWVDPASLTTLDGDIVGPSDSTLVNVGHSGLNNRLILGINDATGYDGTSLLHIDRGGTNSNALPTAGAVAYGDGTKYMFTAAGNTRQVLISQGAGAPIWSDIVGGIFDVRNGLTRIGDSVIEWGGALVHATTIDQAGFDVTFSSASNANLTMGSGAATYNITMDPGTNGFITLNNITTDTSASRIMALDATNHVHVRDLNSLVTADNGLTVSGNNNVQLGAAATGGAPLLSNRFVSLNGQTLSVEGNTGTMAIGTGGDISLNINTGGSGNVTLQGNTLDNTLNFNNLAYVDTNNNQVHRARTSAMTRDDNPSLYLAMDGSGNIVKSISPTNGIFRGQIAGNGNYIYTSPTINIQPGASITVSVQNGSSAGTVAVQVTSVTNGATGTFSVEASDSIPTGSFINYVVMNP